MKNRKLLLIVSLVLAMTMSLGGTLAYLTDTDADVNVMTVGRVSIQQNEQERNADGELDEFTQDKPALPAVYEGNSIPYAPAEEWIVPNDPAWKVVEDNVNVIDKFVTVTNTGNTPAYVRTIVAFEVGENGVNDPFMHFVCNSNQTENLPLTQRWLKNDNGNDLWLEIEGNTYAFCEFVYQEQLDPKDTTIPSMKQVYLDKAADNKNVEAYGKTFDIIALSQAVQASGFETPEAALNAAFPYVTSGENAKTMTDTLTEWFTKKNLTIKTPNENQDNNPPVFVVEDAADFAEALAKAAPGSTIAMTADAEYGFVDIASELNNVTIQGAENANVRFNILPTAMLNNVTMFGINTTFTEGSAAYVDGGVFNIDAGAVVKNLVIEECDITGSGGRSSLVGISEPSAEVTIKNTKLDGTKYMVYASAPAAQITIEGCTVENVSSWLAMMNAGDSVGAVLTIDDNTFNNCTGGIAKYLGSTQPEGAATVFTNNTLTNCKGHDGSDAMWFTIPGAVSTITVSGNTLDGVEWIPGTAQGLGK